MLLRCLKTVPPCLDIAKASKNISVLFISTIQRLWSLSPRMSNHIAIPASVMACQCGEQIGIFSPSPNPSPPHLDPASTWGNDSARYRPFYSSHLRSYNYPPRHGDTVHIRPRSASTHSRRKRPQTVLRLTPACLTSCIHQSRVFTCLPVQ